MATGRKKSISQAVCLPQLIRVLLRSLDIKRLGSAASKKLVSEISHSISVELMEPVEGRTEVRARAEVRLDGKWSEEVGGKPLITFLGTYEARYDFPKFITLKQAKEWLEDTYSKDVLVAQSIPVINLHMHSQLEMLGLNAHSKVIGYSVDSEQWEKITPTPPPKKSPRTRKKVAAST